MPQFFRGKVLLFLICVELFTENGSAGMTIRALFHMKIALVTVGFCSLAWILARTGGDWIRAFLCPELVAYG